METTIKRKNIDLPVDVLQKLSLMAVAQGRSLKAYIEQLLIAKANSITIEVRENPSPSGDKWFDDAENMEAERHLDEWRKSGQKKTLLKIAALLEELCEHPTTGTGKVEQLKGDLEGYWSRRINKASRLIYKIEEDIITVFVISLKGHYGDK